MGGVTAPTTAPARPLQIGPYRCDTPGRAGADGGHHQRRLPPAVPRAGRGLLRLRDDHLARARGAQPADVPDDRVRPRRAPALACSSTASTRRRSGRAVRDRSSSGDLADHIDLNFGCPVPKVTRRGGGAALPYKRRLFERDRAGRRRQRRPASRSPSRCASASTTSTSPTSTPARIAADAGVAAVALHARTAAQRYSRHGRLVGDRPPARRAARRAPGAGQRRHLQRRGRAGDGRRDRLRRRRGRPRLPGPAVAVRRPGGRVRRPAAPDAADPGPGRRRPCAATPSCSASHMGPDKGIRDIRKHIAWYLKGFPVGLGAPPAARAWSRASTSSTTCSPRSTPTQPFPAEAEGAARAAGRRRVGSCCPSGWLDDPDDPSVPFGAELEHSGG